MRILFTEEDQEAISCLYRITDKEEASAKVIFDKNIENHEIPRYLYLIKSGNLNHYKIGITNNLDRRLRKLQTGNPQPMWYVFAVEADINDYYGREIQYLEKFLHKNFEERKILYEWFELSLMDVCKIFVFLSYKIYSRDLVDVIPGTGLLKDVIKNCY
jgi:hypothetical protein